MKDSHEVVTRFRNEILKVHADEIKVIYFNKGSELKISVILDDVSRDFLDTKKIGINLERLKSALEKHYAVKLITEMHEQSSFFEHLMNNKLALFEEIKNASIIYDPSNFLIPIVLLIMNNKVFGTQESLFELTLNARIRFDKIEIFKAEILRMSYNAVVYSAQASLIARNFRVPGVNDVGTMLKDRFVKQDLLEKEYPEIYEDVISAYNAFQAGKKKLSWEEVAFLVKNTEDFVKRLATLVEKF